MSAVVDLGELPDIGPAALCMGVFDGVHLGHCALAERTVAVAGAGVASVALMFDPPPIEVIRPDERVPRLAPAAENLRRLAATGIAHPVGLRFTEEMRQLPPDAFLAALAPAIDVRVLVLTPDSAFGRGRAGTPTAMRALGAVAGFEVVVLEALVEIGEDPVSSSRVRTALGAGDIGLATRLLGGPPVLIGALGTDGTMSFDYLPALPLSGTYGGTARPPDGLGRGGAPITVAVGAAGDVRVTGARSDDRGTMVRIELTKRLPD